MSLPDRDRLSALRDWGTIADIPELLNAVAKLTDRVAELEEALSVARDAVDPVAFPCTYEAAGRVLHEDWKTTSSAWRA